MLYRVLLLDCPKSRVYSIDLAGFTAYFGTVSNMRKPSVIYNGLQNYILTLTRCYSGGEML